MRVSSSALCTNARTGSAASVSVNPAACVPLWVRGTNGLAATLAPGWHP
jgi:hypothetical protein